MTITEANNKLREISKTIKPAWDGPGYEEITEIKKAIKSKYLDTKLYLIKKYEKHN